MHESFTLSHAPQRVSNKVRSLLLPLAALGSLIFASLIMTGPASATGKIIGTYTLAGQVADTVKAPEQFSGLEDLRIRARCSKRTRKSFSRSRK
jgi:hypothetical protein